MTAATRRAMAGRDEAGPPAGIPAEAISLTDRLPPAEIHYALRRAKRLGVGLDETLLATGLASPDILAQAAAREMGVAFDPLDDVLSPAPSRVDPDDIVGLLRSGLMRRVDGRLVAAARGSRLRQLAATLKERPQLRRHLDLTTPERLAAFIHRRFERQLGWRAAYDLRERHPEVSAGTLALSRHLFAFAALAVAVLFLAVNATSVFGASILAAVLAIMLLGSAVLKLTACTVGQQVPPLPLREDRNLPEYTLIVPLYREARVVPQLVNALDAIDYPRERLQVLLAIEPDDAETAAALATHARRPGFEVIVSPDTGPRTKPKAMNAALPFARGALVGIYDAEDIPDPLQLRQACTVFQAKGNQSVGCVQACLVIDNLADGWITHQFAAEYAAYFDVILPMLGTYRLPLPLGGTSNHFRREALEGVGAWDPYNVTEDADLGVRLARAGWRTAVIASTTDEEAPRHLGTWMRQRTRWYKGWMQTLLVHARRPARLKSGAGLLGTLTLLFLLGSGITAALLHPVLVATLLMNLTFRAEASLSHASLILDAVWFCVLLIGYGSAVLSTGLGMRRRRVPGIGRAIALMPLYWLMMSAAAWRAVLQLVMAPYRWEKTDHGLARTSRRRPRILRAAPPRGSGAAPRRPRPAAA